MSKKIVIGITGLPGSGKDTVGDLVVERYGAKKLVFSDLLTEALAVFLDGIGRDDFSWLATNLRERFGEGILGRGMKKKIDLASESLLILPGVRDRGELEMIKHYPAGKLIYVTADVRTRWERLSRRGQKTDDKASFKQFKQEKDKLPTEKHIEEMGKQADYVIENNGSLEELERQISLVMDKITAK